MLISELEKKVKYPEGSVVYARWKPDVENPVRSPYPWGDNRVPLKILKDYGLWILCEVQPYDHWPYKLATATPYRVTVDKIEIYNETLSIRMD